LSSPEPYPAGELALPFPVDPFSLLLDDIMGDLGYEVLPQGFPPAVAGAAIWDDIWNAVKRLLGFPENMAGWLWDRFTDAWNRVWDVWDWFWHNVLWPNLYWVWSRVGDIWEFWWNVALRPFLDSIWHLVDNWFRWLWDSAVGPTLHSIWNRVGEIWEFWWNAYLRPFLDSIWRRVDDGFRWLWDTAIRPFLDSIWRRVDDGFRWLWDTALLPFLNSLWTRIGDMARWVVDNIVLPSWNWLWDNIVLKFTDLTGWIKDRLGDLGETIVNVTIQGAQALGEGFESALRWLFEHVFDPIADSLRVKLSIPRKLLTGQYHDIEGILADFEDPVSPGSIFAGLTAIPCSILALVPVMMEMGSIYLRPAIYEAARIRGATIPTFADLRDAYLRELMSEEKHDEWLGFAGFNNANIDIIKQLYYDIPTPSDLIRMAVREVFDPDVVARFGQMEDFPLQFAHFAKQTGISDFWAHAHWAAHWDLPSATQGFDMFHRDVINEADLKLLLRVLDVMPFWRDRLIKIAYRVISRIDIRRMYNTGVVGRDKVLRVYKDMGYKPEDAEFLTEYVVRAAGGVEKDVPREAVVGAYRGRLILRDEAADALRELGFTDDQVDFFLSMADLQVEQENARLAEDIFEADFKSGAATEAQTRSALAYIGIPEARIELLVGLWRRQAAKRTAGLATSQLQRLYHEGFINEASLRERLKTLGYNDTDITLLVQISSPEAAAVDRQLTLAQAREAFHEGYIDTAEFTRRLQAMGYPPEDISILLDLAQPAEIVTVKVLSVSQLQRAFRQGIINEDELRTGLAERGYGPEAIDALVALSQPAVAVRARELTLSQLQAAFRQGIIDEGRLRSRLLELGYAADAVDILVKLAQPPEVAQAKVLSVSQLQRALRQGLLSEAEVQTQLTGLGYSAGAVSTLIALARPEELVKERDLTVAQNQKAFREGLIDEDELRSRLTDMGFSALDVDILVELALPAVT